MTLREYFIMGTVSFVSSFMAVFSFSVISIIRRRKIALKVISELQSEIETEMKFRDIVRSNFKSGGVDDE